MPHIHSAVQALARHNKMEVRVAIAKQLPQMAQVLDQETCQAFLARYAKLQLQCAQLGVISVMWQPLLEACICNLFLNTRPSISIMLLHQD